MNDSPEQKGPQRDVSVDSVQLAVNMLPDAGKVEVFRHLCEQLRVADLQNLPAGAIKSLLGVLVSPFKTPTLETAYHTYVDERDNSKHLAIHYKVELGEDVTGSANDLLNNLLGSSAGEKLYQDLRYATDFRVPPPRVSEVVLFNDSNNKPKKGDGDTQESDFKSRGLRFADDLQGVIVCATLVRRAEDAGLNLCRNSSYWQESQSGTLDQFTASEQLLLFKLRDGGVRTNSHTIGINASGILSKIPQIYYSDFEGSRKIYALGSKPSV